MKALFQIAQKNNIIVEYCRLPKNESISTPEIGDGAIMMDYSMLFSKTQERVHLAHELGHCMRGAFYNAYSGLDIRGRHEYRANKWAVHQLIPLAKIKKAMRSGYTEAWQLAEYFDVTEDFIRTAIQIYDTENLSWRDE